MDRISGSQPRPTPYRSSAEALHGWACRATRAAGSASRAISETIETTSSFEIDPMGIEIRVPDNQQVLAGSLSIRWPDPPMEQEARLPRNKLQACSLRTANSRSADRQGHCAEPAAGPRRWRTAAVGDSGSGGRRLRGRPRSDATAAAAVLLLWVSAKHSTKVPEGSRAGAGLAVTGWRPGWIATRATSCRRCLDRPCTVHLRGPRLPEPWRWHLQPLWFAGVARRRGRRGRSANP